MDQRIRDLARMLVTYSVAVKRGDKVLIEAISPRTFQLVEALIDEIYQAGGVPFYRLHDERVRRAQLMRADFKQMQMEGSLQLARMKKMDCFIGIRGHDNVLEMSGVPNVSMDAYSSQITSRVHMKQRVPHTRWCILRWPSGTFAQSSQMSTKDFEDFFFYACCLDYAKMSTQMDPLVELMEKTELVEIAGPDTDLGFYITGMPAIKCAGNFNIPDGEVFTAPIKDSVDGVIQYNTPTIYDGNMFDGIRLEFKDGKIIKATCRVGDEGQLNNFLDRDEGARFIGEFALGVNPVINRPMLDILFDEKIGGSFHFTPGGCYDDCDNGNKSQIHWDMVYQQMIQAGGGKIWFDGKLIRKDGLFTLPELELLNPFAD